MHALWILIAVGVITALLRAFVVDATIVLEESMVPTLRPGERVWCWKVHSGRYALERGEVVVLACPTDGKLIVKRIVAVGGDQVHYKEGELTVNGRLVEERPGSQHSENEPEGSWVVPGGHVFVMGDNRVKSEDSRDWGPVRTSALRSKAAFVVWPPGHIRRIR